MHFYRLDCRLFGASETRLFIVACCCLFHEARGQAFGASSTLVLVLLFLGNSSRTYQSGATGAGCPFAFRLSPVDVWTVEQENSATARPWPGETSKCQGSTGALKLVADRRVIRAENAPSLAKRDPFAWSCVKSREVPLR